MQSACDHHTITFSSFVGKDTKYVDNGRQSTNVEKVENICVTIDKWGRLPIY